MTIKKVFICLLFLISLNLLASDICKLEKGEKLNIGCSTKCKYFYKRALRKIGRKYNYPVNIIDMTRSTKDLSNYDGILIPGGADINPIYYKDVVEEDLRNRIEDLDYLVNYSAEGTRRDPFEYDMLERYFSNNDYKKVPLLGICRGMQMLAVSQKVPLYIDIKAELGIRNRRYIFDKVYLTKDESLLSNILGFRKFRGFKQHHQGIRVDYFNKYKDRWPHLRLTSFSNNGLIAESLEFEDRPILGTQFHPEIDFGKERRRIFKWFLNESCLNKKNKK